jgi:DNA-binding transcriptional LysR family regulator
MGGRSKPLLPARLKTRQIMLVSELDEKRSVLRAAETIGVTQPAASRLLAELEEALQVRLFERHARGVVPTWYGEILARHSRAAVSEIRRAEEEISALKAGLAGKASIGTVVTPAAGLVPAAVARLKQKHPRVLVRIERDHSDALVAGLLAGDLDIAVARIDSTENAALLDFEVVGDEPQSVIVRAGHPLARKRNITVADLAGFPWILPPAGTALRVELDSMFVSRGIDPPVDVVEATSLIVALSLLPKTDMLVSLPAEAVQPFCNSGVLRVLPIPLEVRMDSFGIVTRRGRALSPGAQALLGALRAVVAESARTTAQRAKRAPVARRSG